MTKAKIVEQVATQTQLSNQQASEIVEILRPVYHPRPPYRGQGGVTVGSAVSAAASGARDRPQPENGRGGPGACEEDPGFQGEQGRARTPQRSGTCLPPAIMCWTGPRSSLARLPLVGCHQNGRREALTACR